MVDTRTKELMGISKRLFEKKQPRDQLNQEIAEHMYPARADFTGDIQLGQDFATTVYDSYPINARETLANFIGAVLRQNDWYQVRTGNEERDEKVGNARALDIATKAIRAILKDPRTRWLNATNEADHDWIAFGNPVLSVEESRGRDHLVTRAWHPKSCAWTVNENGAVDGNYRKFKMQARNIKRMRESGKWKGELHANIDLACKLDPTREFECLHILIPTEDLYHSDGGKLREVRHPHISIYIDVENEAYLNEQGSPVFNYVIPRWRTLGTDPNGWSPVAYNALPDGRMLQAMARVILEQGEKAVDPPTLGVGNLFPRDLNFFAGGHTEVDLPEDAKLQDKFTTLQTSDGLRVGLELKQDVRAMIAEAMLLNKLYLPNTRDMTAYESSLRNEEYRRAALPFFTPIETDYHAPLLGLVFEMSVNMGLIPAEIFPDELRGRDVMFTFNSPLNEAEGRKTVTAFQETLGIVAAASQVDPTIGKQFDIRKAAVDAVRGTGAEPDWTFSEDELAKINAADEQVKQLATAAQMVQQGAGVVADASNASIAAQNAQQMAA